MSDTEARADWSTLAAALAQDDDDRHEVKTPEWASYGMPSVWVRGLTRNQSLTISKRATDKNGKTDPAISDALQIKWGVVEPALDDVSYAKLKNIRSASRVLQRIHAKISELTGIVDDTPTEEGEAKGGEDDPVKAAESYLKSASR
jgi:hypothetical protein